MSAATAGCPTRLASTAGRYRASNSDAALDRRTAGADIGSNDCDEAFDALCSVHPRNRTENLKELFARQTRNAQTQTIRRHPCPVVQEDEAPFSLPWYNQPEESLTITVADAREMTFFGKLHRSKEDGARLKKCKSGYITKCILRPPTVLSLTFKLIGKTC